MARVLTGIQSSGKPHLGNILGAIIPAVRLSQDPDHESLFFIADLHALTTVRDADTLRQNTLNTAAAWLAFGFDTQNNIFYRQSDVPEVTELTWYLNCLTPYPMLANAHSFKEKSENLAEVSSGLFTYPVLMASDIILYDADIVPVGKDQIQHLEMTRDIAQKFNLTYGALFTLPETRVEEQLMTVPGTDGRKMSKSYGNIIDIFQPDKQLRKNIMQIVTDSTPLEEPKDPDACNVFQLYRLLASESETEVMRQNYTSGNYGYGHAKQALYEKIRDQYAEAREKFSNLMENPDEIDKELARGAEKARDIAGKKIKKVREKIGYQ